MLLLLSFCNNEFLPLVNHLGTNPLSKHYFSCDLTLSCKLLKLFNQNPWTKSGPGDFQFGILPSIFFKLFVVISIFSCFATLTSDYLQTDSICFPKTVSIQPQADHHRISLLPVLIPYTTASDDFQIVCFVYSYFIRL